MAAANARGGEGGLGNRDQGEQPVATSTAMRCLVLLMQPLYRVIELLVKLQIALFKAVAQLFIALSSLASWSKLTRRAAAGRQPQAPRNTQRSSMYRVERFMWPNSRYAAVHSGTTVVR